MAVTLKELRKVAVIAWNTEAVKGRQASIQVKDEEKRTVDNDGESNLFFPMGFIGEVHVTVEGSKSGMERGTISVS